MVAKSTGEAASLAGPLLLIVIGLSYLVAFLSVTHGVAEAPELLLTGRSGRSRPRVEHQREGQRHALAKDREKNREQEPNSGRKVPQEEVERDEAPQKQVKRKKVHLVGIDPSKPSALRHEMRHMWLEGIKRSDRLELTTDSGDGDAHWIYDFFTAVEALEQDTKKARIAYNSKAGTESRRATSTDQKAFLLDMTDFGNPAKLGASLPLTIEAFGAENVYYATRQGVEGRNATKGFVTPGYENDTTFFDQGTTISFGREVGLSHPVGILRYGVRTDVVRTLRVALRESSSAAFVNRTNHAGQNSMNHTHEGHKISGSDGGYQGSGNGSGLDLATDRIRSSGSPADYFWRDWASLPRPLDVASFWPPSWSSDPIAGRPSRLRAEVSWTVESLGNARGLNVTVGVIGKRSRAGRFGVADAYAKALLEHKINVVAQRDEYEGHYRLMEALAGGALVMTDPMHPLPHKLEDGDGVVVYESLGDLREKILYYLENPKERVRIARRGLEVAMRYHRSWHVVERLLLGDWTDNAIAADAESC